MNKLFHVTYFLSVTMGSASYLKAHTQMCGAAVAQQSPSLLATTGKM
jgi:hypothetical protein